MLDYKKQSILIWWELLVADSKVWNHWARGDRLLITGTLDKFTFSIRLGSKNTIHPSKNLDQERKSVLTPSLFLNDITWKFDRIIAILSGHQNPKPTKSYVRSQNTQRQTGHTPLQTQATKAHNEQWYWG